MNIKLKNKVLKSFPSELTCELCVDGERDQDDQDMVEETVRMNNCNVLRTKLNLDSFDDSDEDLDYLVDQKKAASEDSDSDVYSFVDESNLYNPFNINTSSDSLFNPFDIKSKLPSVCSEEQHNSTEIFNPFDTSSPISENVQLLKKTNVCPYCDVGFPSSYNLKQHQVSVHKIFPTGLKIFQCEHKNCSFVTGSRGMYSRHSHAKNSDSQGKSSKPCCPVCNLKFYNHSSLKRHRTRKMHN